MQDPDKKHSVQDRIDLLKKFMEARDMLGSQAEQGILKIKEVIRDRNSRDYLRLDKVYKTLFEHFYGREDWDRCLETMEDMSLANYLPNKYLDPNKVADVERRTGKKVNKAKADLAPWGNRQEQEEEEIDEEIGEEF